MFKHKHLTCLCLNILYMFYTFKTYIILNICVYESDSVCVNISYLYLKLLYSKCSFNEKYKNNDTIPLSQFSYASTEKKNNQDF